VEGRIEYEPGTGNFLLSWNGADESRQTLVWEPPNKVSAIIAAEVSFDPATGLYTYSYSFSNLSSSAQKLRMVFVEGSAIERAVRPDKSWFSLGLTPFLKEELALADGWSWGQTSGTLGVLPGETVSGFELISRHPPGVVRCYAVGRTAPLAPREVPPDELHEAIDNAYFTIPAGFTIGPVAVVPGAESAVDLSDLLSDLDEAERQGWLGQSRSASALRTSLQAIRSSVVDGDAAGAMDRIEGMIRDLSGAEDDGLLSEARALLEHRLRRIRNAGVPPRLPNVAHARESSGTIDGYMQVHPTR
jgi:hypothetical protein